MKRRHRSLTHGVEPATKECQEGRGKNPWITLSSVREDAVAQAFETAANKTTDAIKVQIEP
jgi:hypothetical protein